VEPPSGATNRTTPPTPADSSEPAENTLQGGERYTVLGLHARGGLGRICLARDDTLGRTVALKEIDPKAADDPDCRQRFLNEAALTAQVEHPGVVPIYSLGEDREGRPFYAMKFVHGRTLAAAIADYHASPTLLTFRDLLRRFVDVCLAVAFAHSRGVIHRDLKPANIMLGEYGETQVLDWGLAKRVQPLAESAEARATAAPEWAATDEGLTMAGQVLGTPAYMSPEQAEGDIAAVGPATDISALGAILYELLSGQAPYVGATREVLSQVRLGPPRSLAQSGRQIPRALEAVCEKAMARRPADRYTSASALAREVERWLADEPVEAYREPWHARLGRWARQHRTFVAASAALLLAAVVALSISTVLIGREQNRTERALEQARTNEAEARENLRLAREAVDEYCTRVSEQRLLHQPGMEGLRKELLQTAQAYYQKFVQQQGQDPEFRVGLARAYNRLALLTAVIDSASEAVPLYQQAATIFEQLIAEEPANADHRNELGNVYNSLSIVEKRLGHREEAQTAAHKALVLREELVREHPGHETYHHNLAISYFNAGLSKSSARSSTEVEKLYHKAQELEEQLVKDHPLTKPYQSQLAIIANSLGVLYRERGQFTEAVKAHKQAVTLRQNLVQLSPQDTTYRSYLAESHNNLGSLYWEKGQIAEAREALDKARELYGELAHDHPQVTSYQENLATVLTNLSVLRPAPSGTRESEAQLQQALEIWTRLTREHPKVVDYRYDLADCHMQRGIFFSTTVQAGRCVAEYDKAIAILEQLSSDDPSNRSYRWDLVRGHFSRAQYYKDIDQTVPASHDYRKVIALLQALLQEDPKRLDYRWTLAQCRFDLGVFASNSGQAGPAGKEFRQTLTLLEPLTRENPERLDIATRLGQCYYNLGREEARSAPEMALKIYSQAVSTLEAVIRKDSRQDVARTCLSKAHENRSRIILGQEHHEESLAEADRALELAEGARRDSLRLLRVIILTLMGKHGPAAAEAEKLAQATTVSGATLNTLGSVLALCSAAAAKDKGLSEAERARRSDEYAVRSIALFRKAQAAGYFKSREQVESLKTDSDLAALRPRADFKKLLADLEQKK
jgi:serine/threonine-protein kinase